MNRIYPYLEFLLIALVLFVFTIPNAHAATVYTKQAGTFEQCKSAAGAVKYHCIDGTGCPKDTLKCVLPPPPIPVCTPPSVLNTTTNNCETPPPPPKCPQYTTGTYPACVPIPCGSGFTGNEPNCIAIPASGGGQTSFMPSVDISKNMTPVAGSSVLRIFPTSEKPSAGDEGGGQFRISCPPSHMSNDDPIVYPNQPGASHHHTFFGNTSTDAKTNPATLSTTGNSTCNGGIMNRSAYWVPSMIDTSTKTPIKPTKILVYYKTEDPSKVTVPPKGLRMIAGNSKATTPQDDYTRFTCNEVYATHKPNIPACKQGDTVEALLSFPNCWDGKNLDSPDHKSHMAYSSGSCPATHPVRIPEITFNVYYAATAAAGTANWRLASDNYTGGTGGNSWHGDWMNGWDETFLTGIVNNCLRKAVDCHAHLLGDGRMFD